MENIALPSISCVCVTRNKPTQLKRAIECFLHQTYPNKELVIISEDNDPATRDMLISVDHPTIKWFEVPSVPKMPLGGLRNLSISKASGDYFCQWDDDDWYHSCRLQFQMTAALNNHKPASLLAYWMMYDGVNGKAFLSPIGPWAGSILCKRSIIDEKIRYPDLSRKEDHIFMGKLIRNNCTVPVIMPSLYIYAYHGNNTFNLDHFNLLFASSQELSKDVSCLFRRIFDDEISYAEASEAMMSIDLLQQINYFYNKNVF